MRQSYAMRGTSDKLLNGCQARPFGKLVFRSTPYQRPFAIDWLNHWRRLAGVFWRILDGILRPAGSLAGRLFSPTESSNMAKRKPKTIPAITMQQPHCWALMSRKVKSERRTHQIEYRGPVAIIAGKRYVDLKSRIKRFREDFPKCPDADDLPCGVIVGVVDVTRIWITDEPGMRFVWELRKPRLLKNPKPFAGGGGGKIEVEAKLVRGLLRRPQTSCNARRNSATDPHWVIQQRDGQATQRR
jgi:hypothetical protein